MLHSIEEQRRQSFYHYPTQSIQAKSRVNTPPQKASANFQPRRISSCFVVNGVIAGNKRGYKYKTTIYNGSDCPEGNKRKLSLFGGQGKSS